MIIDITGKIQDGMWNYEYPFPQFHLAKLPKVDWIPIDIYCEIFEGLHSQTGTYIETPAHFYGNDKTYLMDDVPLEKLVGLSAVILMVKKDFSAKGRQPITREDLAQSALGLEIKQGQALLIGTGWGEKWMDADYLANSPYFTYDAMMWILEQKPSLLGSDFPRWDNLEDMQGFFPKFYEQDILMFAPCVNLEKSPSPYVKLTALPLRIPGTSCIPCRAYIEVKG